MNFPPSRGAPVQPLSLNEARIVTGATLGLFDNYAGGVVVRWRFEEGESSLLAIANESVFDLLEQFEKALAHFRKHQIVIESAAPIEQLASEDFEKAVVGIRGWYMDIGSDGILWRFNASNASSHVFLLRPPLIASIHHALKQAIDLIMLIDLRPLRGKPWLAMMEVLETLPGPKLRAHMTAFEFSFEIFRRNGAVLVEHLQSGSGVLNDELVRWDRRFQIDTFLRDAIHLLFNFVGAAMALVDHTRGFYERHYKSRKKITEYQAEVERRFVGNGLVRFVQEMRNLMAHVGLVGLVHQKRFSSGGFIGRVLMKRDEALVWSGWTSVTRAWLTAGPPEIDMLDVVNTYIGQVNDFHDWFAQARERVDWADFRYAELLRRAVLARRGLEDIPALKNLLTLPPTATQNMRDSIGAFLTAEQQFDLRNDEMDGARWLRKALELVRNTYYVPEDLCSDLLAHFSVPGH